MDKREQIARMAQTKEDEMLLAKIYERMTNAAARNIPAATGFLSKREQMLAAELLRGQEIRFYGGPPLAEREICCYLPEYLDESWLESEDGPIAAARKWTLGLTAAVGAASYAVMWLLWLAGIL